MAASEMMWNLESVAAIATLLRVQATHFLLLATRGMLCIRNPLGEPMKNLLLMLLFAAIPAHANWQYTHWGMSPAEVRAASGNTVDQAPDTAKLLTAPYEAGGVPFRAFFYFEANQLSQVGLKQMGAAACTETLQRLIAKYGDAVRMRNGNIPRYSWRDAAAGNLIWLDDLTRAGLLGGASCFLMYSPLNSAGDGL
jgi:hypothetical protein